MRRWILTRAGLTLALAVIASLVATSGAQAVVVDMNAIGQNTVAYNAGDTSDYAGVALVPEDCNDLWEQPLDQWATGTCGALASNGIPTVTSSGPCTDPSLSSDLWTFGAPYELPSEALCYHGGPVMNQNETFALTWDAPNEGSEHNYWETTRDYVEQFLRDVADGSGTGTSPYALTAQYTDQGHNRAQNSSRYGGGCIDYGSVGGSQCDFGTGSATGHDYPATGQSGDCTAQGSSFIETDDAVENSMCLTDAQIQSEVSAMVSQEGIVGHTQAGYTPTVVVLTPPGVETCLDAAHKLCSANGYLTPPVPTVTTDPETNADSTAGNIPAGTYRVEITYVDNGNETLPSASTSIVTTGSTSTITVDVPPQLSSSVTGWYIYMTGTNGQTYFRQGGENDFSQDVKLSQVSYGQAPPDIPAFCSYHSQVDVGGTDVPYVVQPWVALTACDEPDAPAIPANPSPLQLETDFGIRLVSPLSQSEIPAIVNPDFSGWYALNGFEMNDNAGCRPFPQVDNATVGGSSQNPYLLQHEFNNAAAISGDPNTYGCAPNVFLNPAFVVPSAVDSGDAVEFDGSATQSTLMVPNAGYQWNFGDGSTATGPSVEHSYSHGGTFNVTLTVTDRGGNVNTLTQAVTVLGPNGQTVPPGAPPASNVTPPPNQGSAKGFRVRLILLPQSLRSMLKSGVFISVNANEAANGYATVSITRATAKKAHIKTGRGPSVTIGIGTLSKVRSGVQTLHLHLSKAMASKLSRLRRVNLTVRLVLIGAGGGAVAIDAAGHY